MAILADLQRTVGIVVMCALFGGVAARADGASPKFTLTDQNGRTITEQTLVGKPTVIHFGFTHCPVVCPTTLYETAERMKDLGAQAEQINFVFVSIDPERDTPEVLKTYIRNFDDRIIGLTGKETEVAALARALGASYSREKQPDGTHTMEHTVYAVLVDRDGRKVGTLFMGVESNPKRVVERLQTLVSAR